MVNFHIFAVSLTTKISNSGQGFPFRMVHETRQWDASG